MNRYAIWDKQSPIITPIGEVLTASQWIERYPIAGIDGITIICGGGEINGAFFGTLSQMVDTYTKQGCDFSDANTPEEKLAVIEAFEDAREKTMKEAARAKAIQEKANAERQIVALEAIASGQTAESTKVLNALLNGEGV